MAETIYETIKDSDGVECFIKRGNLVRCKDCWKKGNPYLCRFDRDLEEHGSHRTEAYDAWFCADGERKPTQTAVYCKDCKNACMCDTSEIFPDIPIYAKCTLTDKVHKPYWFCADGEKRDD